MAKWGNLRAISGALKTSMQAAANNDMEAFERELANLKAMAGIQTDVANAQTYQAQVEASRQRNLLEAERQPYDLAKIQSDIDERRRKVEQEQKEIDAYKAQGQGLWEQEYSSQHPGELHGPAKYPEIPPESPLATGEGVKAWLKTQETQANVVRSKAEAESALAGVEERKRKGSAEEAEVSAYTGLANEIRKEFPTLPQDATGYDVMAALKYLNDKYKRENNADKVELIKAQIENVNANIAYKRQQLENLINDPTGDSPTKALARKRLDLWNGIYNKLVNAGFDPTEADMIAADNTSHSLSNLNGKITAKRESRLKITNPNGYPNSNITPEQKEQIRQIDAEIAQLLRIANTLYTQPAQPPKQGITMRLSDWNTMTQDERDNMRGEFGFVRIVSDDGKKAWINSAGGKMVEDKNFAPTQPAPTAQPQTKVQPKAKQQATQQQPTGEMTLDEALKTLQGLKGKKKYNNK